MAVELILLEDVDGLGSIGDRVRVADGYSRNYLIPRGLAVGLTPANLRRLEAKKLQMQREYEERLAVAQAMAERLAKTSLTIAVEAAENDRLYGSVNAARIVEALAEAGLQVERHSVVLEEPIRELGVYTIELHLHDEVQTSVKVWVVRA